MIHMGPVSWSDQVWWTGLLLIVAGAVIALGTGDMRGKYIERSVNIAGALILVVALVLVVGGVSIIVLGSIFA